jgi:hypothetical protein
MDPTARVHQILFKSRKKSDGDPGNDYKTFVEETQAVRGKSKLTEIEKVKQVKSKACSSFSLSIPNNSVTFYGE